MPITIVSKTTDYQVRNDNQLDGYRTVPGEVVRADFKDEPHATVLDGMIDAQNDLGQVHWIRLTTTIAHGWINNAQHGGTDRVVVIDTDNADGSDVIDAMNYLHAVTAT